MTKATLPHNATGLYCQPWLPWSLYPASSLAGTLLLPLPPTHPDAKNRRIGWSTYPALFDKTVIVRSRVLEQRLDYQELTDIARHWFRVEFGFAWETGGIVALIRVLSVLSHLTDPRRHRGDPIYDCNRFWLGFAPVPGGNLCTLLWLGYRYVQAFAAQLRMLDKELEHAPDTNKFDSLAKDVLRHAARVPGHDLLRARDRSLSDDDLCLWPDMTLEHAVKRATSHLSRAVGQARRATFSQSRTRIYPIRSPRVRRTAESPSHLSEAQILSRNFHAYVDSATDILGSLVELLRLCGHVAVKLQRYLDPATEYWGLKLGRNPPTDVRRRLQEWRRIVAPLDSLAALPQGLLDTHFADSWRETELPHKLIRTHRGEIDRIGQPGRGGVLRRWRGACFRVTVTRLRSQDAAGLRLTLGSIRGGFTRSHRISITILVGYRGCLGHNSSPQLLCGYKPLSQRPQKPNRGPGTDDAGLRSETSVVRPSHLAPLNVILMSERICIPTSNATDGPARQERRSLLARSCARYGPTIPDQEFPRVIPKRQSIDENRKRFQEH